MKQFYSSLIINSKRFPDVHQVFKPRFNKEFFKRITANIQQLEAQIERRCKRPEPTLSPEHLIDLKNKSKKLVNFRERLEKSHEHDVQKYDDVLAEVESIEDQIMPTVIRLPNRSSNITPATDQVVEEFKSDFMSKQGLSKVLSHRKLSYINHCYSKSVVGPNSHYYFGIGAKVQNALSDYFTSELERERFIPTSGLCLVKSALVEATNSSDSKEYFSDPARVLTDEHRYTTLHLTESSRESLVGFVTTLGQYTSNDPLRFMSSGSGYKTGTDWFDGDDRRISQYETLNTLTLNSSIEQYSMKEYLATKDIIWSSYKKLELPLRLVHCSLDTMLANEYDSHRIEVWLPSRQEWIQTGRVSHYLNHITIRVGMKRGHLIDSCVFNGQVLTAAIIENKQTSTGKFIVPDVLEEHSIHLTPEERHNYYRTSTSSTSSSESNPARVFLNHEQKRHYGKRNHPFGHSHKASKLRQQLGGYRGPRIFIGFLLMVSIMIDWDETWYDYVPDSLRAFLFDYIYRPYRRIKWKLIYGDGKTPADLSYAQLDRKEYERSTWDRKRDRFMRNRYRNPDGSAKDFIAEAKGNSSSSNASESQ